MTAALKRDMASVPQSSVWLILTPAGIRAVVENLASGFESSFYARIDWLLFTMLMALLSLGLVFEASASVAIAEERTGNPLYYLGRHFRFLLVGFGLAWLGLQLPIRLWVALSPWLLFAGLTLLILVLVPGFGVRVNGSQRWLNLGFMSFQVSEFAKLSMILFLAGYVVRRGEELRAHWSGFSKPLVVLGLMLLLLLLEPDFGSAVVMSGTVFGVLFLAGIPLMRFMLTVILAGGLLTWLAISSDYRMNRLLAFMDPWADQFNTGYQLTQALIAFGRGEWLGVGIGNSLQKLFYLPEAHTDFVFAVIAEESGMFGATLVVVLLWMIGARTLRIGRTALAVSGRSEAEGRSEVDGRVLEYAGYCCIGIGLMFLMQCFVNIGVSCGLLPTKGLTLPFVSYGGSSLLIWMLLMSIVLRSGWELRQALSDSDMELREEGANG